MAKLQEAKLIENIENDLADNNAGAISARDVRQNMVDIVESINWIVASGDFDGTHPFYGDVRIFRTDSSGGNPAYGGILYAESGVQFPYGGTQIEAYPGLGNLDHNDLNPESMTQGDPHTQYLLTNGTRTAQGNIGFDNHWINSSGNFISSLDDGNDRGLQFEYLGDGTEVIHVGSGDYPTIGSGTYFKFDKDNSILDTSKGIAKAWLNFDGSETVPVVNSYHNIHILRRLTKGKYQIVFTSGTFANNNYIAIGSSNARSAAGSPEDFTNNTVGITSRSGNDADSLRNLTFAVLDEGGEYVDAKINELVVYGISPGEISGVHPTVEVS